MLVHMSMSGYHDLEKAHSHICMKSAHAAWLRGIITLTPKDIVITDPYCTTSYFSHLKVLDSNLDCRSLGFISHFLIKV